MKIAMFSDYFHPELGGIQDSIATLAAELGRRGHEVFIWVPAPGKRDYAIVGLPRQEIDLGPSVHIVRIPAVAARSSSMQSRLALPLKLPQRQWLAGCEVVHVHSFFAAGLAAIMHARRLGLPLVGTNHWVIAEYAQRSPSVFKNALTRLAVGYVNWFYSHCSMVSAPSKSVCHSREARGKLAAAQMISNPIDTVGFSPVSQAERHRLRTQFGFDGPVIACVGRLSKPKRTDFILRAFAQVAQVRPDSILAYAGHGTFLPELRRLAEALGVAARVRFLGTLSPRRLADFYRAADVYVIASAEAQSMTLLQALATGLPAVGANWRAVPEYLPAQCGMLFEKDNEHACSHAILTLLNDKHGSSVRSADATRFAQNFSVESITDQWESLYSRVIATRAD